MGGIFGGSRQPKVKAEVPQDPVMQAIKQNQENAMLLTTQPSTGYQEIPRLNKRQGQGTTGSATGGFFGAGGKASNAGGGAFGTASDKRSTFLS